ncbi:MAG: right-handed parallel beta-helix repeat-containing protein [Phycisphaeraceae bacterium]|nr:right-handed parallel beta-helix repeat-containing protein [Phycisphaeraceae bacterium]MCW5763584.1 right-handed parallel beta-helix repeat-containing protein [Phycisphaeraceae bacterium]
MSVDSYEASGSLPGGIGADRRALLAGLGGLAAGALFAGSRTAHAGPLNPPPGPIAPTGKTLTEVEPRIAINATNTPGTADATYRISQPGSYYLSGNLVGQPDKYGILIESSDVSIDLGGFAVLGVGGIFTGIAANSGQYRNIIVRNGIVRNWGGSGVQFITGHNALVEHIITADNGDRGISVGTCAIVRHCIVQANGNIGIECSHSCIVEACTVRDNGNIGLQVGTDSVVTNCTAVNNALGIALGVRCIVRDCTAQLHKFYGFSSSGNTRFEHCTAEGSGSSGFLVQSGCSFIGCSARNNTADGIRATDNCLIASCLSVSNGVDGIRATNRCIIRGNVCSLNGTGSGGTAGAGIHTAGIDNRIEDNNCTGNGRGIDCDTFGSIIVRNSCSGNTTNWDLAADNRHGGIVNVTALSNPAVVGLGGATSALVSENPWANFSY